MSKRVILITMLVLVITLSGIGVSCGPSEPAQFVTYTNEADGFAIDYPQGWDIEHPTEEPKHKVSICTETWRLQAVCIMVYKDASRGLSLEWWSESLMQSARDNAEDYASISTMELTVNGMPAVKHTFTRTIGTTSCTTVMVCSVEGETVWTLFFNSPEGSFDSYKSTFDTALNSFRLLE